MKFKLIFLLMILSLTIGIAEDPMTIELKKGENNLIIEDYFPAFPVSYLIFQYPEVQSVSMNEYGQTLGYVNTFGGIGTDFLIMPGRSYEIYVSQNISINLIN